MPTVSATSIRVDQGPTGDKSLPMAEGNRVLESIARQESLGALLAFSDLHEQIRQYQLKAGAGPDSDLSHTERFFLDEVLQLVCSRALALTGADAVMVALSQAPDANPPLVCRASAGQMPVPRGIRLNPGSEFLQACLAAGTTLRCDDSRTDPRLEFDLAQAMEAQSTVLVPLRGRGQRVGVLQAFAKAAWTFTDDDVRCLELVAEMILAALRPEDEDRRFLWLAEVAEQVLQGDPAVHGALDEGRSNQAEREDFPIETTLAAIVRAADAVIHPIPVGEPPVEPAAVKPWEIELPTAELLTDQLSTADPAEIETLPDVEEESPVETRTNRRAPVLRMPEFRMGASEPAEDRNLLAAHPGLSVVMGLVAVAALFSAGVWWGMQEHGKVPASRVATQTAQAAPAGQAGANLVPASTAASGSVSASGGSSDAADNLMEPAQGVEESALSPVPASKLAALPKITALRHWSSAMGSTVVIDMEDQVPYEVHRLMSPERIYFDLHDTALAGDLEGKTFDVGDPTLSRVRIAQPVAGVTRIVLDTKGNSNFSVSLESDPYRLIVELREMPKALLAKTAPTLPGVSADKNLRTQAAVEPTPIKTGKFRIVLDAGHGGWDLGTVGRQGLVEKDLVLDVTRRLGKLLHDRLGSEVMFTRTSDDYLPLEQRADFANHAQADLFVSVHANYSASATARGVETYYTNLFAAPGSKEMDKQALAGAQLTPAGLSAAGLHEKTEESRRLALDVQRSLYATLAAKSPDIRDRGIKDAAFVVLTGTTMPSILTEISFVSSPTDEHNLLSEAYRQQIAEALYKGIARYQESSPRARVAQLQPAVQR